MKILNCFEPTQVKVLFRAEVCCIRVGKNDMLLALHPQGLGHLIIRTLPLYMDPWEGQCLVVQQYSWEQMEEKIKN